MLDALYHDGKRKRGTLGKITLASGQMIGNSLGTKAGMYAALGYAVSKEIYTLITTQQLHPITSVVLEALAIIGTLSLAGRRLGYYATDKTLGFVESL
jgi:hypothetical protein